MAEFLLNKSLKSFVAFVAQSLKVILNGRNYTKGQGPELGPRIRAARFMSRANVI